MISVSTNAFAQKQKSKEEYLKEISTLSNTKKPEDLEQAYKLSKEFVAKFPKETGDNANKLKDFIKRYRLSIFFTATDGGKFAEAFALGKEILAEEPENTDVLLNLAFLGYKDSLSNKSQTYSEDSIGYAQKTLQLFEKGVVPTNYSPFKDKTETTSFMYFVIGNLSVPKDMKIAAANIYKATLYESAIKNSFQPYYQIADYYEGIYQKIADELNAKVKAKTISDADFKTENERVEKALDLMMDAYARALKRAEAQNEPDKVKVKTRLLQIYQFRKKTDAAFNEYVTYINTMPMPDPAAF